MSGLTPKDLAVLDHYAKAGNRELYWNYLARHPGNDGYGLLALGVVRNDNAPGATANLFAANVAATHGVHMTERQWNAFGVTLMRNDLKLRAAHLSEGNAAQALNLPARDVQAAHDGAFRRFGIEPDAWTPRQLLEAARHGKGEPEAERIWHYMLDNSARGAFRLGQTTTDIVRHFESADAAAGYLGRLAAARAEAAVSLPTGDPDRIGADRFYYLHDARRGGWMEVNAAVEPPAMRAVDDPKTLHDLDDTRALRLERARLRRDFHPDDPNRSRPVVESPWLISDGTTPVSRVGDVAIAERDSGPRNALKTLGDAAPQSDAQRMLLADAERCVSGLDTRLGRAGDDASRRLATFMAAEAGAAGLCRIDHVVLSHKTPNAAAGALVFAVQGGLTEPTNRVAMAGTEIALSTPVDQSLARLRDLPAPGPAVGVERVHEQRAAAHQRTHA